MAEGAEEKRIGDLAGGLRRKHFPKEEFESLNYWVGTQAPALYGICYFWKFALGRFFFFFVKSRNFILNTQVGLSV